MQYRMLGKSQLNASVVAFGAWAIGGWMWGGDEEVESIAAIHAAIDNGINFIDTAPIYGFGHSELIVGKAIKGIRNKVIIATKCGLVWDTEKGVKYFNSSDIEVNENETKYKVYKYLHPKSIRKEVEKSLKRLGIDEIDLLQTHWQEETTPIEETMGELLKLKEEGKIRAIGCSNASIEQMDRYRKVGELDCDQELYSMIYNELDKTNLPYCKKNNIAFLAYSPLAQGLLTGKITEDREFKNGDKRQNDPKFSLENRKNISKILQEFQFIANSHDITMTQLIIAWTFSQPGCTHVLAGARNAKQAMENAKAGGINLSKQELADIQEIFDKYKNSIIK